MLPIETVHYNAGIVLLKTGINSGFFLTAFSKNVHQGWFSLKVAGGQLQPGGHGENVENGENW